MESTSTLATSETTAAAAAASPASSNLATLLGLTTKSAFRTPRVVVSTASSIAPANLAPVPMALRASPKPTASGMANAASATRAFLASILFSRA